MIFTKFGKLVKELFGKTVSFFDQVQIGYYFDCLVISLFVAIAFFSFGPSLDSSWGIIDDHEIVFYSPANQPLGFSEIIPTLLTKTEISPDSTVPRYRPVFYFLRLVETRLWSAKSPFYWYLSRIVLFITFCCITYLFFKRINGRIVGGLLTLFLATLNFWNDIISRLGPAETYGILGLIFFLIGVLALQKNKENDFAWFVIMIGSIICVGSKENLQIILIAEIFVLIHFYRKSLKRNVFPLLMVIIPLLFSIWIIATVFLRIKMNGSDLYGNSVVFIDRLMSLTSFISNNALQFVIIGFLLVLGIVGLVSKKTSPNRSLFLNLTYGSIGILILILSQVFFYSDSIWGRYNFPYVLYLPFTISLVTFFFQNLPVFNKKSVFNIVSIIISGMLIFFFIQPSNLLILRKTANEYNSRTKQFQTSLHDVEYFLSTNSSASIVFYGTKPEEDYEKIISFVRFIRSDSFGNDNFIYTNPPIEFEMSNNNLRVSLSKQLVQWSLYGNLDHGIMPINEYYKNPNDCLLLSFSPEYPKNIKCSSKIIIDY